MMKKPSVFWPSKDNQNDERNENLGLRTSTFFNSQQFSPSVCQMWFVELRHWDRMYFQEFSDRLNLPSLRDLDTYIIELEHFDFIL